MRWRRWPWLVFIPLALAAGTGMVRLVYLERDMRRELGDELAGALEVARIEIENWNRTHPREQADINDRTFASLATAHRIHRSRTSLLARRGDSIVVLATASRDTASQIPRRFAAASAPSHIARAFAAGRKTAGTGDGFAYDQVVYATMPVGGSDWMLLREVDGYSLVELMLLPLLLDLVFVTSLFLFAIAWLRSQARLGAMKREQELSRVRADFLTAVSHELRTPLAQIRMFAELLRGGAMRSPEESRRALNVIEKESSRLSILVDNLLNYASVDRAAGVTNGSAHHGADVNRDIQYVIDAFAPLSAEKEVKLVPALETVSPAMVDSQKLRQILLNFLENAQKYGPRKQTVTIGSSESNGRVRVWVEDEGPGVPESEREEIWKAFHRGTEGARSRTGGSGIGLSVVHDLVAQHGGTTWVERSASGGARFIAEFDTASANRQLAS